MKTGISTACLYPMAVEKAFETVATAKPQCCEVFFGSTTELQDHFVNELAKRADFHGIDIVSVHPYSAAFEPLYFFSDYERRTEEGYELYKKYFNAMTILGAKYLIFHGEFKDGTLPNEIAFERMSHMCEIAKSFGVHMSQENVSRCKSRSPDFLLQMSQAIPDMTFTLDIKQAVRSDVDPFYLLDLLKERIVHLHISDHLPGSDCILPGHGNFDFNRLVKKLNQLDYNGGAVIELYSRNVTSLIDLQKSYEFIRKKF
ncbi:MAG: sugar phosphate isomerase/epimerase [Oscillospiraceae bacterium]